MTSQKREFDSNTGFIPDFGYITARELADRLELTDYRTVQNQLEMSGVSHATVGKKRLYQCSELKRLFFNDE